MTELTTTVPAGQRIRLAEHDAGYAFGGMSKKEGRERLVEYHQELSDLQRRLYAGSEHALLIVLQGMDTAGKDGTIRHVMGSFSPQGVETTPFKVPTEEERAHDFLWRIHKAVPKVGMVGVFNRSHYEDVLVVRVKELVPEAVWRRRYERINQFEQLLTDNRVTVVKLFLHISPEEQGERLRERQQRPDKRWKFTKGDLEDRALWPHFMDAYEDALSLCNTEHAPWHIVPANRKWSRNLVVSDILLRTLKGLEMGLPEADPNAESYVIPDVEWP